MKLREVLIGSASLLAILAATAPAACPGRQRRMETVVVTGYPRIVGSRARHQARFQHHRGRRVGGRYRQVPGQKRGRRAATRSGRQYGFGGERRRRLRRERPRLHPRHQLELDADDRRRTRDLHRRLVHPRPVSARSAAASAIHAVAGGNRGNPPKSTRASKPILLEGGVAGEVDIQTRKPLDFKDTSRSKGARKRPIRRCAKTPRRN